MRGDVEVERISSHYRRLILLGKLRVSLDAARRIVGPDCAYHLYYRHQEPKRAARRRRRLARH